MENKHILYYVSGFIALLFLVLFYQNTQLAVQVESTKKTIETQSGLLNEQGQQLAEIGLANEASGATSDEETTPTPKKKKTTTDTSSEDTNSVDTEELQTKVKSLETKISTLELNIATIEKKIAALKNEASAPSETPTTLDNSTSSASGSSK